MISWDFFRLTAPMCPGMAASAVSLSKSYDIVILSFWNIVKGQANCINVSTATIVDIKLPKKMVDLWEYSCLFS